ncbi:MAG: MoxR family ATPase [Chloroherpetonaceae bacterium]|nr:MoxR family ATPase [Chthonomonadaceae bacterium]MDW8207301.1 MoxR family ATPase [Chloroherpetonaceae bacterium]
MNSEQIEPGEGPPGYSTRSERSVASAAINPEQVRIQAERLLSEVRKVIVGQDLIVQNLLLCLFARGHCLLIGVPGLAKTLLVRTLAQALSWEFRRIQFTPDLMPSDILGTEVLETDPTTGARRLRFVPGPIFANVILADEINRTPPRTQSALLEAMQETHVTVGGRTLPIEKPFFVVATQNPIEQEGTYPLPEAQLDRFMFSLNLSYPTREQEEQIVSVTTTDASASVCPVFTKEQLLALQQMVRQVPASPHVISYAVALARASRPQEPGAPPTVRKYVEWGAGPRASQYLVLGAKARAVLSGKPVPTASDVRAVAAPVLNHRIIRNYAAVADGITPEWIVHELLQHVPEPDYA